MNVIETEIPDVKILEPKVLIDERGFFFESFNQKEFEAAIGLKVTFVQDNHSRSEKNVLRGLHYQTAPMAQGKLVRVLQGEIFDVSVDLRKSSPTFGKWVGVTLSAKNHRQLWIPEGFAHGFYVLSQDGAECSYKTTEYYSLPHERSLLWNDPTLAIAWPLTSDPVLSPKDTCPPLFLPDNIR